MQNLTSTGLLPRSRPERQGLPSRALLSFLDSLEGADFQVHSLMLLRHGRVVAEAWWRPYDRACRRHLYSLMVFSAGSENWAQAIASAPVDFPPGTHILEGSNHLYWLPVFSAGAMPEPEVLKAAGAPTTIRKLTQEEFERLYRHGYEVANTTLQAYCPADFKKNLYQSN